MQGLGSNVNALEDAREALRRDPQNARYRMLVSQLESGGQWYQTMGSGYGYERPDEKYGQLLLAVPAGQSAVQLLLLPVLSLGADKKEIFSKKV